MKSSISQTFVPKLCYFALRKTTGYHTVLHPTLIVCLITAANKGEGLHYSIFVYFNAP